MLYLMLLNGASQQEINQGTNAGIKNIKRKYKHF